MLGWDHYGFHKKRARTSYKELVFLHPMGYVGHVVHSSKTEAQKVNGLFLMLGWDRYEFHKKRARTHYTKLMFLHPVGSVGDIVHSAAFVV
jgi:hypothetical protein